MDDKRLNELLKWSIEQSDATRNDPDAPAPSTQLTPQLMASLLGGPSDADLLQASMDIITSQAAEHASLDEKLIPFDNF